MSKIFVFSLMLVAFVSAILGGVYPISRYVAAMVCLFTSISAVLLSIYVINRRLRAQRIPSAVFSKKTVSNLAIELHAMQVILNRFPQCDIPTTSWSMRFTNLHAILDLLDQKQPETIVEFGSGISTLMVAVWIRERGQGSLVSFDHDASWAAVTQRYLNQHGFDDVTVNVRPLKSVSSGDHVRGWYDIQADLPKLKDVDFLIVDGPPAGGIGLEESRLPALSVLKDKFAEGLTVVLDDAQRPGEQRVVRRWTESFPNLRLRNVNSTSGLAILESDPLTEPTFLNERKAERVMPS